MKEIIMLISFTALVFMACEQQSNEKAKAKKKRIDAVGVGTVQPTTTDTDDAGEDATDTDGEAPQVVQTPEAQQQVQQTPPEAPQAKQNGGGEPQKVEEVADVQVPFVSFEVNKAEFRQSVFKYIYENPPPNNDNNLGRTYNQKCIGQVRLFLKSKGVIEPARLSKAKIDGSSVCWDYIYDKDGRAVHLTAFDNEYKAFKKAEDAKKASP